MKPRSDRKTVMAKAWATRRANAAGREAAAYAASINAERAGMDKAMSAILGEQYIPGKGEIVGGEDAEIANELVALARTKGGVDKVQAKIRVIKAQAEFQGAQAADKRGVKTLVEAAKRTDERIVCGFISEVEAIQRANNGLEGPWTVSAITIVKIIDALNEAGYTSRGKRS